MRHDLFDDVGATFVCFLPQLLYLLPLSLILIYFLTCLQASSRERRPNLALVVCLYFHL